jgi:hypothetical protein
MFNLKYHYWLINDSEARAFHQEWLAHAERRLLFYTNLFAQTAIAILALEAGEAVN